jgi:Tfp pilus assembly protein PilN
MRSTGFWSVIQRKIGSIQPGRRTGPRIFQVNLSSRYRWYLHPARQGFVILCGILGLAILWDVGQSLATFFDTQEVQASLQRLHDQDQSILSDARQQGIDLSAAGLQRLPGEVALANQLIEKRSFSWTRFLTELEQAIPPRMAINSIRLAPSSSQINLTGSSANLEDITALTVSLQDHSAFSDPVLGQHRDAGNGMVAFDLTLRYRRHTN